MCRDREDVATDEPEDAVLSAGRADSAPVQQVVLGEGVYDFCQRRGVEPGTAARPLNELKNSCQLI